MRDGVFDVSKYPKKTTAKTATRATTNGTKLSFIDTSNFLLVGALILRRDRPTRLPLSTTTSQAGPNVGRVQLMLGDAPAGPVEIPRTWPTHGTTAGLNCGQDAGAPVTDAYQRPFHFTGLNLRVIVDLEGASGANQGAPYQTVLREQ